MRREKASNRYLIYGNIESERKEYLFGMGTDFRKLKAPLVWLDILHVLDVLSRFKVVHNDPLFGIWWIFYGKR